MRKRAKIGFCCRRLVLSRQLFLSVMMAFLITVISGGAYAFFDGEVLLFTGDVRISEDFDTMSFLRGVTQSSHPGLPELPELVEENENEDKGDDYIEYDYEPENLEDDDINGNEDEADNKLANEAEDTEAGLVNEADNGNESDEIMDETSNDTDGIYVEEEGYLNA